MLGAASVPPRWLLAQERVVLERLFENAKPRHVDYISYPRKIAVVFEFDHVVICGACSAPTSNGHPRGRVIRVSFDRRTHAVGDAMQFCETRTGQPPKSLCFRR